MTVTSQRCNILIMVTTQPLVHSGWGGQAQRPRRSGPAGQAPLRPPTRLFEGASAGLSDNHVPPTTGRRFPSYLYHVPLPALKDLWIAAMQLAPRPLHPPGLLGGLCVQESQWRRRRAISAHAAAPSGSWDRLVDYCCEPPRFCRRSSFIILRPSRWKPA